MIGNEDIFWSMESLTSCKDRVISSSVDFLSGERMCKYSWAKMDLLVHRYSK